jgi:hypothetical protein
MMLFGAVIGTMMTVGTLGLLYLLAGFCRISKPPGVAGSDRVRRPTIR